MLLAIFFIIGTGISRGSLNYIIVNAIPNIGLVTSPLMSNSSTLIISCYGKVGYYPFFSVLSTIYYSISYLFILFDVINKQVYLSSFTLILNESVFFRCSEYRLILIIIPIIIPFLIIIVDRLKLA